MARCPCSSVIRARCQAMLWIASRRSLRPRDLRRSAAAERREWWLANGRGGYAGGTIALSLTRRYHGLLIAPVDPPLGRVLVLTKADATLHRRRARYPLFTNRWAAARSSPTAIWRSSASISTARSRSGGFAAATRRRAADLDGARRATRSMSPGDCGGAGGARARLSLRSSPTAATIMATPGRPALTPRLPPRAPA